MALAKVRAPAATPRAGLPDQVLEEFAPRFCAGPRAAGNIETAVGRPQRRELLELRRIPLVEHEPDIHFVSMHQWPWYPGTGAADDRGPHGSVWNVPMPAALPAQRYVDALTRAKLQDELLEIVARTQSTVVMVTHDVDEAVLLSDKIVMLTNGPAATIGEVLAVDLPRPRKRVELAEDPQYVHYRKAVIDFLYTRQAHVEKLVA